MNIHRSKVNTESSGNDDKHVRIALVVAMANNGIIGKDNALPWRIPEDLRYFKQITLGKKIVMGRKTFESIGSPLPGRKNIVITRNPQWSYAQWSYAQWSDKQWSNKPRSNKQQAHSEQNSGQNIDVVHTVEEALELAVNLSLRDGNREVMVIGGEQIYRETLCSAERLYLTRVFADVEGDASFPALNNDQWREVERREFTASSTDAYNYAFTVLDRVTG
jgi:dihydrofolate reductase